MRHRKLNRKCFDKHCDAHGKIIAAREAKKTLKEKKLKEKLENENIDITGEFTCQYVYKRGKNKGMQCMCKKPLPPTHDVTQFPWYCKSHHKLILKKIQKLAGDTLTINNTKLEKLNYENKIINAGFIQNQNLVITI